MAMSPRGFDLNGWVNTDGRKRLSLNINAGMNDNAAGGWGRSLGVTFNIKPSDAIDAFDRSRLEPVLRLSRSTCDRLMIPPRHPRSAAATSSAASINGS